MQQGTNKSAKYFFVLLQNGAEHIIISHCVPDFTGKFYLFIVFYIFSILNQILVL